MCTIQKNIPLKEHTTFAIGGGAQFFVVVDDVEALRGALAYARDNDLVYFILAGGSNVLFSDAGFDGLVIKINFREIFCSEDTVRCGAGMPLLDFLFVCARQHCSGLENLAGVPGTVGGAVRGNAGAFGSEISDCIISVDALDVLSGNIVTLSKEECDFTYRKSLFKDTKASKNNARYIIVSVLFSFAKKDENMITKHMREIIAKRESKHIQDIKSAGSFFMNPVVDKRVRELFEHDKETTSKSGRVPAGWLLERVGLDQKRIGGIQAGEMHANYFINVGEGTAQQVILLASLAKTRVRDEFGVQLTEEVTVAGF